MRNIIARIAVRTIAEPRIARPHGFDFPARARAEPAMRKRTLVILVPVAVSAILAAAAWRALVPSIDPRPLPPGMIALATPDGQALLAGAEARADYPVLSRHYETQMLKSFCGVASSVAVLTALGQETSQPGFFTDAAQEVRPGWRVVLAGMSLDDLGGFLTAHGAGASVHHADAFDADGFRDVVSSNLARPGDYLIVNYQRESLGQDPTGHISPVAAFDADTDSVLVMDTASYKYPKTWVPLDRLYTAMRSIDTSTGAYRGYVEVRAGP
jgi:hypothetical protein